MQDVCDKNTTLLRYVTNAGHQIQYTVLYYIGQYKCNLDQFDLDCWNSSLFPATFLKAIGSLLFRPTAPKRRFLYHGKTENLEYINSTLRLCTM